MFVNSWLTVDACFATVGIGKVIETVAAESSPFPR